MLGHRILIGLVPIGALLSACADNSQQTKTVPADSSGKETIFTTGFQALAQGDNVTARNDLQQAYNAAPNDIYDQENLAAADQNTGDLKDALPLYRQVIANGKIVTSTFVTRPEVQGMTMAQIAQWNLKLAGVDMYGNALQPTQAAALAAPQRKYEVYFGFDRTDITPEGASVVSEAAKNAMAGT